MYQFVDFYSLLKIPPESTSVDVLAAIQNTDFVTRSQQIFRDATRILLDPVLRVSYDQEYCRVKGIDALPIQTSIVEKDDAGDWLNNIILDIKTEAGLHPLTKYHYTVNESLLEPCKETPVGTRVFNKETHSLDQLRNEAYRYFDERKKLIDFWIPSNIYDKNEDQEVELNIRLVEQTNTDRKEQIVKSLKRIIPQSVIEYEAGVLKHCRNRPPNFGHNGISIDPNYQNSRNVSDRELYPHLVKGAYYQILDITSKATQLEIENAYKRKQNKNNVSMWHPDWTDEKDTYANMRHIHDAYKVLSDPKLRLEYDAILLKAYAPAPAPKNEKFTSDFTNSTTSSNYVISRTRSASQSDPQKNNNKRKHWFSRLINMLRRKKA